MASIMNGGRSVMITGDKVYIDGKEYKKPGRGNTSVQIDNKIYINGYEFKNGKFKRSLRAFIECYILF